MVEGNYIAFGVTRITYSFWWNFVLVKPKWDKEDCEHESATHIFGNLFWCPKKRKWLNQFNEGHIKNHTWDKVEIDK